MVNKGKIFVIGIGPGNLEHMSQRAIDAIKESEVVIGYKTYTKLVEDLIKDKEVIDSGMRKEVERCELTLNKALEGKIVSIISSGDSGIYGMAGIIHEVVYSKGENVEIEVVPGITASNAAAASLGAPIMHDSCTISLSDLLTDWELIKKRLECAAMGDFVVCIYNPRSKGRVHQIEEAREIMLKHKKPETIVGIVKNAKREGEKIVITNLAKMLEEDIDMVTMVIVGNEKTYVSNSKMITPRGYKI